MTVFIDSGEVPQMPDNPDKHTAYYIAQTWERHARGRGSCSEQALTLANLIDEIDRCRIWERQDILEMLWWPASDRNTRDAWIAKFLEMDIDEGREALLKAEARIRRDAKEALAMRAKEVEPVGEKGKQNRSTAPRRPDDGRVKKEETREEIEENQEDSGIIFDKNKNVKYNTGTHQGGNAAAYRIAKLKRDFPEIAKALEAGKYKSVSEAERAAGIRPPLKTPVERLVAAYGRLSEEEKAEFLAAIGK